MKTSEILIRAKATFTHWPTLKCAYLAIGQQWGGPMSDEWRTAADLLARVVSGRSASEGIWRWYDRPERTLQDVRDAFDAAIAIAQQQERGSDETTDPQSSTSDVRGTEGEGFRPDFLFAHD